MKKFLISTLITSFILAVSVGTVLSVEQLRWVGCSVSKKAFMDGLAAAYEKEKGVKIVMKGGSATEGIRGVVKGKADIGGTCRHVLQVPEEIGVKLTPVAWDALVVITNPSNPVKDISATDLKDVLQGKIKNWKALGGADMPIKVAVRKGNTSGTDVMLGDLLFKKTDIDYAEDAVRLQSSGPVEVFVEQEKNAIAVSGISSARKRNVRILNVNGVEPSRKNIINGSYMFYRPLYLVSAETPSPEVEKFVRFVLSEQGQKIIANEGTINLTEGEKLNR